MSKEKQIEEMARALGDTWICDLEGNPHDLSEVLMQCDIEHIVEQLYEIGYRKQSENTVEVVRCKDCVHYKEYDHNGRKTRSCIWHGRWWQENDYCNDGVRKGGE